MCTRAVQFGVSGDVTSSGVQPLPTNFPRPRSNKSLQEYLGMLNFYGRFVPHAAAMLLPLYELVNVKGGEFEAAWTARHDEHFQRSKMHWPQRHT